MPDCENYYGGYEVGASNDIYWSSTICESVAQIQQQYEEWQRQEKLKREEQKMYPLFFWRETCKPVRK